MPRYIDADALKEEVGQIAFIWSLGRASGKILLRKAVNDYTNAVIAKIDNTVTADVVEVVRCKDCKHGREYKHTKEYVECKVDCEPIDRDSDFFCKYGERRDNERTDQRL